MNRLRLIAALIAFTASSGACNVAGSSPTATLPPTPQPAPTDTAAPTATTDPFIGWQSYHDELGFAFRYPPQGVVASSAPGLTRIDLPFTAGTNLSEKYLEVVVDPDPNLCQAPPGGSTEPDAVPAESLTINGVPFIRHSFIGAAAGSRYDATAYSTVLQGRCLRLGFMLRSADPGNFATPPPEFDRAAEAAMFEQIMSTFELAAG